MSVQFRKPKSNSCYVGFRQLAIFALVAIYTVSCDRAQPTPPATQRSVNQLIATNIKFSPDATGQSNHVKISYSILNEGGQVVPAASHESEFLIDGKLVCFDRDTPTILPRMKTDYTCNAELAPGRHHYELRIFLSAASPGVRTTNEVTGTLDIPLKD
jgi:hypothetical protein